MGKLDSLLTYEEAKRIFNYDPETGYIRQRGYKFATWKTTNGYNKTSYKGKRLAVHRVVWLLHKGEWPKGEIDHINRNRADNRIENLRDVSRHVNAANRPDAASMTGTTWHPDKRKWKAKIQNNKKYIHIGYFNTQIEAHEAYLRVRREICGM
jgi:hypothetical protein